VFSYHRDVRRPSDEMLGHKRQYLFGSRHGFAQLNQESLLEHWFEEYRDFIVFFRGIIHSLSFLKAFQYSNESSI
jgi:hypothetical protein